MINAYAWIGTIGKKIILMFLYYFSGRSAKMLEIKIMLKQKYFRIMICFENILV